VYGQHCRDDANWHRHHSRRATMGKYFLGWLLGVPVVVLVLIYLFFH
jgi:hypothetical protein